MFFGTYEHTMDKKGRISLPARFREILSTQHDGKLVVTTNMDPEVQCLAVYPTCLWQEFTGHLLGLSPFNPDVVRLKRLVIASASDVTPDRQGRILVPPHLRRYAALQHEAIWAGMGNNIELWDRQLWMQEHNAVRKDLHRISQAVSATASVGPTGVSGDDGKGR